MRLISYLPSFITRKLRCDELEYVQWCYCKARTDMSVAGGTRMITACGAGCWLGFSWLPLPSNFNFLFDFLYTMRCGPWFVARWVVFQVLGLPYNIAFEQRPLSSDCAFGVWHEERLKTDTQNLSCSLEEDFNLRKRPGVLATSCVSVYRSSARHYLFSVRVFLRNWRLCVEN